LWRDFFLKVAIPVMNAVSERARKYSDDYKYADGVKMRPFLTLDGELCILSQMLQPQLAALLKGYGIDVLKLRQYGRISKEYLDEMRVSKKGEQFRDDLSLER
jgi:hypothetical protein